jgi:hypothetical protein
MISGKKSYLYVKGRITQLFFDKANYTFKLGAEPSQSIKLATYAAIVVPNVQRLSVPCPTGNCTWPVTPSIAICGACTPVNYTTSCNSTNCVFTMPSGSKITIQADTITGHEVMEDLAFLIQNSNGSVYKVNDTSRLYLTNLDIFGQPYTTDVGVFWSNTSIISSECALWVCVQAYQVSVDSLQQSQLIVQTVSDVTTSVNYTDFFEENSTFAPLPASMNPPPDEQFTFGIYAASLMKTYITSFLTGNISINLESKFGSNDYIEFIWNSTSNPELWIENIAVSLSNAVRVGEPAQDDRYDGTAFILGVSVRWYWLSLPLLLVGLSLVFLIINIYRTSRSGVGAWKGSPLALLFCDIEPEVKDKAGFAMYKSDGLKDVVGKTKMVLEAEAGGEWVFKPA